MSVERINPRALTYDEALDIGHVITRSFSQDSLFRHVAGEKYVGGMDYAASLKLSSRSSNFSLGLSGITSPQERVNKTSYDLIVRSWANLVYKGAFQPGHDFYRLVLYNDEDNGDGKPITIGVAIWTYPKYMHPQLEFELDRSGLWFKIQRLYVKFRVWLSNFWHLTLPRRENPVFNRELMKFARTRTAEFYSKLTDDEFLDLPEDEIAETPYPKQYMIYLMLFGVLPEYMGSGFGKRLLQGSLNSIPNTKLYLNNKVYPQKLHLEATDPGRPLYEKFGFKSIKEHNDEEKDYHSTYMILTR